MEDYIEHHCHVVWGSCWNTRLKEMTLLRPLSSEHSLSAPWRRRKGGRRNGGGRRRFFSTGKWASKVGWSGVAHCVALLRAIPKAVNSDLGAAGYQTAI